MTLHPHRLHTSLPSTSNATTLDHTLDQFFTVASSTLTTWSKQLASHFDSFVASLPPTAQSLIANFRSAAPQPANSLSSSLALRHLQSLFTELQSPTTYSVAAASLLAFLFAIYSMTSFGRNWGDNWSGRRSPYTAASAGRANVNDQDFEYVGPDHNVMERTRSHDPPRHSIARPHNTSYGDDDLNLGPDIILIRHLGATYHLKFKPFSISDGLLKVGDIRKFAADTLHASNYRRVRLLYKGQLLKDDQAPAKSYGLKQQSEVHCVVSEALTDDRSDHSGSEGSAGSSKNLRRRPSQAPRPRSPLQRDTLVPPGMEKIPSSRGTSRASSPQPPARPDSPRGKVQALTSTFRTQWAPKCDDFLNHPPSDAKTRDQEYKKLSEMILAQILVKADAIEMEGDQQARTERKSLINEANEILKRLDAANKGV